MAGCLGQLGGVPDRYLDAGKDDFISTHPRRCHLGRVLLEPRTAPSCPVAVARAPYSASIRPRSAPSRKAITNGRRPQPPEYSPSRMTGLE